MSRIPFKSVLFFGLLLVCVVFAAGQRTALVIETEGQNMMSFNGKTARMRTLQVLPQGARISVAEGATLRLSYLGSGIQETIEGPCEVEILETESRKISGDGKLDSRSGRGSSTDLPSSENLRRTGGALHASITESPGEMLARIEWEEALTPPAGGTTRDGRTSFLDRQRAYLDPGPARRVTWEKAPQSVTLRLTKNGQQVASMNIKGDNAELPPNLKPGLYTLELKNGNSQLVAEEFTILSAKERKAIEDAEAKIRKEEPAGSRTLYVRLLRLQSETGLYGEAEKTAEQAIQAYPDDSGFLFMAALLKEELGKREEAKELLRKAEKLEAALYD